MYNAKRILSVFLAMLLVLGTFAVGGAGLALTASADASLPLSGSGARKPKKLPTPRPSRASSCRRSSGC